MISRFFNYIIHTISWNFIFRFITRFNFRLITSNFRAHLLTLSIMQSLLVLRDLVLNRVSNNIFFRIVTSTPTLGGINPHDLINSNPKKIFWIGFVASLIIFKVYNLIKKIILWPFKLGIYAFIYAISGFDVSWIFSWFDVFKINIPQWVYIQYLNLYSSWLDWWKGTVQIKNIKPESLPAVPKTKDNLELVENTPPDNKWINRKNLLILAGAVILISIGLWYYYYSGNSGTAGGQTNPIIHPNPPAPNSNDVPHTITITDNQTIASIPAEPGTTYDPNSSNLIDRLDATEAWGGSSSDAWDSNNNRSPSPTGSTDSSETIRQDSFKADYDHYFPPNF